MSLEDKKRFLINAAFWAVIAVTAYAAVKHLVALMLPFILAFIIAALLQPLIRLLHVKCHLKQGFAAVACCLIFFGATAAALIYAGTRTAERLSDLLTGLPEIFAGSVEPVMSSFIRGADDILRRFGLPVWNNTQLVTSAGEAVVRLSETAGELLAGLAAKLPGMLISALVMVTAAFFTAADYDGVVAFIIRQVPGRHRKTALDGCKFLRETVVRYLKSYVILFGITLTCLAAGLMLLRVRNALMIAFFTALLDILPVIGIGIVLIPWAVAAFLQGSIPMGAGLTALFLALTVLREVIEPRIVGKQVGLHPLAALMCIFVGGSLFGLTGLLLVPVTAAVFIGICQRRKNKKNTPEP